MRRHAAIGITAVLALFAASEANAAGRGHSFGGGGGGGARTFTPRTFAPRVQQRTFQQRAQPRVIQRQVAPKVIHPQVPKGQSYRNAGKPALHHVPKTGTLHKAPGPIHTPGQGTPKMGFVNPGSIGKGIHKMPHFHPKLGARPGMHGRLGVPHGIRPKLTSLHRPHPRFHSRLQPFVQRHWKKAFFWVAVAGIGYMTIPEYLYPWYQTNCTGDDPDYDQCSDRLAFAAIDEDEESRVHYPMPSGQLYRRRFTTEPTRLSEEACSLSPFVERRWNKQFVWIQVPQVGNVTVPEDSYDSFVSYAGNEPPNYKDACKVLVRAAASDTVETTSMQTTGFDTN